MTEQPSIDAHSMSALLAVTVKSIKEQATTMTPVDLQRTIHDVFTSTIDVEVKIAGSDWETIEEFNELSEQSICLGFAHHCLVAELASRIPASSEVAAAEEAR